MDETIEEEMSQDMEKGFSVLGKAFGVSVNSWGDLPLRLFWDLPLSDICKWLAGLSSLLRLRTKNRSCRLAVLSVWDVKELHIGTFKNDHLYPSLRKQPTFRDPDATTGLPAKWRLSNRTSAEIPYWWRVSTQGPFRFSKGPPRNLSGPRANFNVKSCWIAAQFLARKPVNFLCLLIVSIYHVQLWSWTQTWRHKTAFRAREVTGTFEKRAPDLSSAFDWLKQVPSRHNQIRNNTLQIWVRRDTSVLISIGFLCSFHWRHFAGKQLVHDVAKCRLFSKGGGTYGIITVKPWWECTIRCFSFTSHNGSTTLKIKESIPDVVQKVLWATTNPLSFFNYFFCTTIKP